MAKIKFRDVRLSEDNKGRLAHINRIIIEYQNQGLRLTLRQLYYQLVSRDVIPNQQKEYAKLSKLLKEGRMAGIVDWDAIEDRLRIAEKPSSWNTPADIVDSAIHSYQKPRMNGQKNYIEVWVEKDALSGVLSRVTEKYHIPILVNRGYSSASAIFDSYKRFRAAMATGQKVIILYVGDYDPSGIDMIRDVRDRPLEMLLPKSSFFHDVYDAWVEEEHEGDSRSAALDLQDEFERDTDCYYEDEDGEPEQFDTMRAYVKRNFEVVPIALTKEQITQYKPPPNPAKITDPRSGDFISKHGKQSWEVDALRPEVLNAILEVSIQTRIDDEKYEAILKEEKADIKKLELLKSKL